MTPLWIYSNAVALLQNAASNASSLVCFGFYNDMRPRGPCTAQSTNFKLCLVELAGMKSTRLPWSTGVGLLPSARGKWSVKRSIARLSNTYQVPDISENELDFIVTGIGQSLGNKLLQMQS